LKTVMKIVLLFAIVLACTSGLREDQFHKLFGLFQQKYNKNYPADEVQQRLEIFKENYQIAAALTRESNGSATFGITKFSDLTQEEFKKFWLMPTMNKETLPDLPLAEPVAPTQVKASFDWRSKGAITPVYNQQQCGSCWAFSATETIESYYFLSGHPLTGLSMQQIVDCDTSCYGCNGGWTYLAFEYVEQAGGLTSLNQYPYTAQNGACQQSAHAKVAHVTSWSYVTRSDDEKTMLSWINSKGPISVCVDAQVWQFYTGGVVGENCGKNIDHCVQITGYSDVSGQNVWNVRNSWGEDWGDSGYIYVKRGCDCCAIAEVATVVSAN